MPVHGRCHRMDDKSHRSNRERCLDPELVPDHEIGRHQGRNNGAADIHRENRARRRDHQRHDVAHAEEVDDLPGLDGLAGQDRDRDIEIAADQRAEQQKQRAAGPDAEPHIGISEDVELNQDDQSADQQDQDRKQPRRQRQIVILGIHDLAQSRTVFASSIQLLIFRRAARVRHDFGPYPGRPVPAGHGAIRVACSR